jgi:hypothetical protein
MTSTFVCDTEPTTLQDDYEGMSDYEDPVKIQAAPKVSLAIKKKTKRIRFKLSEPCLHEGRRKAALARKRDPLTKQFVKEKIVWRPVTDF